MSITKKRHINLMSVIVLVLCLLLVSGNVVFAEPYLQLDAVPSVYVGPPEESIVVTDPDFDLYALVNNEKGPTDGFFYLSAAIVPSIPLADPGDEPVLGSFTIAYTYNSFTFNFDIDVVADMRYGSPPINAVLNPDEIAAHGVFDTYYEVFEFEIDLANQATLYNSMDTPGVGPILDPDGTLYYQLFDVDVSGLDPDYAVHFDLFTENPDGSIAQFAPFSHDVVTPEPASFLLGSIGIGMVIARCRKRKTLIES